MNIGGREVVHTASLLIPQGEDAVVNFNVDHWHISMKVLFVKDEVHKENKNKKESLSFEVVDGEPQLSLINWTNSLGTATTRPIELGKSDNGVPLFVMVVHWLVGNTNRLDLQFLLGSRV